MSRLSRRAILFVVFLVALVIGAPSPSAIAQENILKGIELSQENGAYVLKLKASEKVPYKKSVDSNDSVYFDLKNITSGQNVETFYNEVDDVDGVVVQQLENDRLRIYVNGENTKDTTLTFDTAVEGANEIVLNKPMSEYAPVSAQIVEEESNWGENGFNLEYLLSSIFKKVTSVKIDFMLVLCAIAIVGTLIGLKSFLSKVRSQQEPLIGIAGATSRMSEFDLDDDMDNMVEPDFCQEDKQPRIKPMRYDTVPQRPLRTSQPAHRPAAAQQPARNYGLNTYQKSQGNPYANSRAQGQAPQGAPSTKHFTSSSAANPVMRARAQAGAPVSQQRQRPQGAAPAQKSTHIDSIKFLESVTKIYEQNGRKDLATGLKASLNKSKIADFGARENAFGEQPQPSLRSAGRQ